MIFGFIIWISTGLLFWENNTLRKLKFCELCGLISGLVFWVSLSNTNLMSILSIIWLLLIRVSSFGASGGLISGLINVLISGFRGRDLDIEKRTVPNQGIWNSIINTSIFAIIGGSINGSINALFILLYGLSSCDFVDYNCVPRPVQAIDVFINLLPDCIFYGLIFSLIPGIAVIKHLTLRVILYCKRCIPWNYARFLDYATERIFLQKVGGGYIFIHRLLMEHLAQIELD